MKDLAMFGMLGTIWFVVFLTGLDITEIKYELEDHKRITCTNTVYIVEEHEETLMEFMDKVNQ